MKRKSLIRLAGSVAAGGAAVAGAVSCGQSPKPETRPNILFLIAEDMSLDLSCYGAKGVHTPNLDRLASEGVLYTNARCCASISSPTRSAMMTGVHQTVIDAHNHRSNRDKPLPEGIYPFTYYLRQAGYTCVLGNRDCFCNPNRPDNVLENSLKLDCNFKFTETGPYDGKENFGLFDRLYDINPEDVPYFAQITFYVTHRGDWWKSVRAASAHPVDTAEVEIPPFMPDTPVVREERACLLDQVEYMDNEVGMVLEQLDSRGLLDNTVIFFVGDNGRCDVRDKAYLYEGGTTVPMLVWSKGVKHSVVKELVSELDITASILYLAGIERPGYYQGNVLDAFKPSRDVRHGSYDYVYTARDTFDEIVDCIRAVHDDRYTYIRNYRPDLPYDQHHMYMDFYRPALHEMRRMYALGQLDEVQASFFAPTKPEEELYDYQADPFNIHNLADDPEYASVLSRMRGMMDEWLSANHDGGIEDRYTRVITRDRLSIERCRYYLQTYRPEEWARIEAGEICDSYDAWKVEMKAKKQELGEAYYK